jgi:hypothetical protein
MFKAEPRPGASSAFLQPSKYCCSIYERAVSLETANSGVIFAAQVGNYYMEAMWLCTAVESFLKEEPASADNPCRTVDQIGRRS